VVVVDDGIATGSTVRAALLALRGTRPAASVLAVPVGPPETISALTSVADTIVCPLQPAAFYAVGQWYDRFGQVSTPEVLAILERHEDAGAAGAD
jgi:predicted phosphoribosyltransferase